MTAEERYIRFKTALDIIQNIYSDYCNDVNTTREQAREFCDFVIDMIKYSTILQNEIENKKEL